MENSLWNGQLLIASDISKEYAVEKEVRKASGNKELCCPDPDCQQPVLRYCHGEIRDAYFAHLDNALCDYADFDKRNTHITRMIRRTLYEHFKHMGYDVRPEIKVLEHHYTHLLFNMSADGRIPMKIALEIGSKHLSARRIDNLTEEYLSNGIQVKWIVISDTGANVQESHTYFIKRYLLNESVNRDLIVINRDGNEIAQYKADPDVYSYKGRKLESANYPKTYVEISPLDALTFEGTELSIKGFNQRYADWLNKKREAYEKKIALLEEKRLKAIERKRDKEQKRKEAIKARLNIPRPQPKKVKPVVESKAYLKPQADVAYEHYEHYEQGKNEVSHLLGQVQTPARDSFGKRWLVCEECGIIDTEDKFYDYGGSGRATRGICYDCKEQK